MNAHDKDVYSEYYHLNIFQSTQDRAESAVVGTSRAKVDRLPLGRPSPPSTHHLHISDCRILTIESSYVKALWHRSRSLDPRTNVKGALLPPESSLKRLPVSIVLLGKPL
jgi:hypothetical protein